MLSSKFKHIRKFASEHSSMTVEVGKDTMVIDLDSGYSLIIDKIKKGYELMIFNASEELLTSKRFNKQNDLVEFFNEYMNNDCNI